MKIQSLMQKVQITEYKDGCVYRTKSAGFYWVTITKRKNEGDTVWSSISTKDMVKVNHRTMRTVSDETPDYVPVTL